MSEILSPTAAAPAIQSTEDKIRAAEQLIRQRAETDATRHLRHQQLSG